MNTEPDTETILQQARQLPAAELSDFLGEACRGRPVLRQMVEAALAEDQVAGGLEAATLITTVGEHAGAMIGRYKLLERLGEGGMGTVWMAEQREPMVRRVALKIIKLGMDTQEVVARFEQERQALALMDHPCIARVFDAGATESGRPYFVMELVRGVPVTTYCDEQRLAVRERLGLFMQVCQAVQHAHQKGIIHRDLKPTNILVTAGDEGGPLPKVIDFGIAKATGRALTEKTLFTQLAQIIGTPAYMSPEQARWGPLDIDTRSDIYSLGVLLYELLTGRPPFDPGVLLRAGLDEMRRVIREDEPLRPSTRISTLSEKELTGFAARCGAPAPRIIAAVRGDLDWIVMKALDKNRNRRYETATGLALDIQRHLESQPVLARPPGTAYLFSRFVRRHKFGFAASTAVAVAMIGGIAAAMWGLQREEKARKFAESLTILAKSEAHRATLANIENKRNLHLASMADLASALRAGKENFDAEQKGEFPVGPTGMSRWREGVALLIRSLEREPENRSSALWLYETLRHRAAMKSDWPLKRLKHEDGVQWASFSLDGARFVTASRDGTARVWEVATGHALGDPMRHDIAVSSASFSPDGTKVVTGSLDLTARIWDPATGKTLGEPMRHDDSVGLGSARFSPDGARVVTWHPAGATARVWDAATGHPLGEPMRHDERVHSASFSPDGTRVVTWSDDNTARVWDAATGKAIGDPMRHGGTVWSASFSPDGSRVVTASTDKTARIWDTATGKTLGDPMRHDFLVSSASFSPDGTRVVTASFDTTARVWDAATGKAIGDPMRHDSEVRSASFSPDGFRVVTTSLDKKTARVWHARTGHAIGEPIRDDGGVLEASFSPNGTRLFTVNGRLAARVWDAVTSNAQGEPMRHGEDVISASFSPDGTRVVTASLDNTARVWHAATGQALGQPMDHSGPNLLSASFSPDGTRVVTASNDKAARMWDAATGHPLGEPMRHDERLNSASFSPNGTRVVTASNDKTARVWDAATGHSLGEPMRHDEWVNSASFSPDGTRVVTASSDYTARVWDAATGHALGKPMRPEYPFDIGICDIATFSPDGTKIVTVANVLGIARVWDATTGQALGQPMQHGGSELRSASFSPDGSRVVTASTDNTARVWDTATGHPLGESMRHGGTVNSATFSLDGTRVVTASDDKTARVWDAATGKALGDPMRHWQTVWSASFSPDGSRVVTASRDESARVWEVTSKEESRSIAAITPGVLAWAQSLNGLRFGEDGEIQVIPYEERIAAVATPDLPPGPWADLAMWINTPAPQRTIDVKSRFSLRQIAERERDFNGTGSLESLHSALQYDPTVPLARLFLATALERLYEKAKPADSDPNLPQRTAFLRRYDLDALAREEGNMKSDELAALWVRAAQHLLGELPDAKVGIGPRSTTAREEALKAARKAVALAPGNTAAQEVLKQAEATEVRP